MCRFFAVLFTFFFFKQKTAYEMRISDWSSDVCSSDLGSVALPQPDGTAEATEATADTDTVQSQISELVRRIDRFQSSRSQPSPARSPPRDSFLFEAGPDGLICWADGLARGPIVRPSIAEAAFGGEPGVDAITAAAFRRRPERATPRPRRRARSGK